MGVDVQYCADLVYKQRFYHVSCEGSNQSPLPIPVMKIFQRLSSGDETESLLTNCPHKAKSIQRKKKKKNPGITATSVIV